MNAVRTARRLALTAIAAVAVVSQSAASEDDGEYELDRWYAGAAGTMVLPRAEAPCAVSAAPRLGSGITSPNRFRSRPMRLGLRIASDSAFKDCGIYTVMNVSIRS